MAQIGKAFGGSSLPIDKIFKDAKLADLAVEQPAKFDLVINLKTAKIFSLDIPENLPVLADEVIE